MYVIGQKVNMLRKFDVSKLLHKYISPLTMKMCSAYEWFGYS